MDAYQQLKEQNIELPPPTRAIANYLPFTIHQNSIYVSGQLPISNGEVIHRGQVGTEITLDQAIEAAELCCINLFAQLNIATNQNLNKIKKCLKLGIFVSCTPDFTDQPLVGNGASNLMVKILGDKGKHARFAVGCPSLPLNACVEIDGIFAL